MAEYFFDVEQGSEEWRKLRVGLPTASRFSDILAKGEGKRRADYLDEIGTEMHTGNPSETYSNAYMERGNKQEAEARELYRFYCKDDVRAVGFVRNTRSGCSPDALVGEHGILEIKTIKQQLLTKLHRRPQEWFPPEHLAQCAGALMITGREWCDLFIYAPRMEAFQRRLHRNTGYLAMLADEVALFHHEACKVSQWLESLRRK